MKSFSFSLFTTLPLRSYYEHLDSLLSWSSPTNTTLLIESDDAKQFREIFEDLQCMGFKYYIYKSSDSFRSALSCQQKSPPSLRQLQQAFHHSGAPDECNIFFNADIYLSDQGSTKLYEYCLLSLELEKTILFHRLDITDNAETSSIYYQGFDAFILPGAILDLFDSFNMDMFSIGQVGWDYAYPFIIGTRKCLRSSKMILLHRAHPTSSTCSWETAILEIANMLTSHRRKNSIITKTLACFSYKTYGVMKKICRSRVKFYKIDAEKVVNWLFSRLTYFAIVKPALDGIQKV